MRPVVGRAGKCPGAHFRGRNNSPAHCASPWRAASRRGRWPPLLSLDDRRSQSLHVRVPQRRERDPPPPSACRRSRSPPRSPSPSRPAGKISTSRRPSKMAPCSRSTPSPIPLRGRRCNKMRLPTHRSWSKAKSPRPRRCSSMSRRCTFWRARSPVRSAPRCSSSKSTVPRARCSFSIPVAPFTCTNSHKTRRQCTSPPTSIRRPTQVPPSYTLRAS